jgi:hypothetical protein
MKLLPSAKSRILRWTLLVLVLTCTFEVVVGVRLLMAGQLQGLLTASFFLVLGSALWLRLPAARVGAVFTLWLFVLVVLAGLFSPGAVTGYFGLGSSYVRPIVLALVLCGVGASFAIYVLGKHKREFR